MGREPLKRTTLLTRMSTLQNAPCVSSLEGRERPAETGAQGEDDAPRTDPVAHVPWVDRDNPMQGTRLSSKSVPVIQHGVDPNELGSKHVPAVTVSALSVRQQRNSSSAKAVELEQLAV